MTSPDEAAKHSRRLFLFLLGLLALLYAGYGRQRFSLGLDFTDEGGHLAWPLRMLFGERPFTSELVTLTRPIEAFLFLPFKVHPAMTLYEFRLAGWSLHLLAFGVLAAYLFKLSAAPLQSVLIASVPVFICNIYGIAGPYYNTLASDFLVIALGLRGLCGNVTGVRWQRPGEVAAGGSLFIATLAHPALGLVAAIMVAGEFLGRDLARNTIRGRPSPSNLGVLVFLVCWLAFAGYLLASGTLADWWERWSLYRSLSAGAPPASRTQFFLRLAAIPFAYNRLAIAISLITVGTAVVLQVFLRTNRPVLAARSANLLAFLLLAGLTAVFRYNPERLPLAFAFVSLVLIATHCANPKAPLSSPREPLQLMLLSGLSAVLFASFTYFFTFLRSWTSGILGLPVAFAIGLALLLKSGASQTGPLRALVPAALLFALAGAAREHSQAIYRDAAPAGLVATSRIPVLRGIHSTPERMQTLDQLYDYLQPRLARGTPLLVYDNCPLLYYLFSARPVYGLTWASQFGLSPAVLRQLDHELNAQPLPPYAIRLLVDVSAPSWSDAPRTRYEDYPLNNTVLEHYEREQTFFPFEIWRLRPDLPAKHR